MDSISSKEVSKVDIEMFDVGSLSGGAVAERITRTLDRVASNILDRNTDAAQKREVTIKLEMVPSKGSRRQVTVAISVTAKLAGEKADVSFMRIDEGLDGVTRFKEDPDAARDHRQIPLEIDRRMGSTGEVVTHNLAEQLTQHLEKGSVS